MKKFSFPPIVNENAKVLILGTMPGEKSLKLNQYYANPTNQFWKIIYSITNAEFILNYRDKTEMLLNNRIAIWDVLMHCEREGSLDQNISDEAPNDFKSFFLQYPHIEAVFFNGGKAANLFEKYRLQDHLKKYITLPSTSSANTSLNLEGKTSIWKERIETYL